MWRTRGTLFVPEMNRFVRLLCRRWPNRDCRLLLIWLNDVARWLSFSFKLTSCPTAHVCCFCCDDLRTTPSDGGVGYTEFAWWLIVNDSVLTKTCAVWPKRSGSGWMANDLLWSRKMPLWIFIFVVWFDVVIIIYQNKSNYLLGAHLLLPWECHDYTCLLTIESSHRSMAECSVR